MDLHRQPRRFQFSLRRLLFWVVPLVALSASIASCRADPYSSRGDSNPPGFIAAKAGAIAVITGIWAILVWEDCQALLRQNGSHQTSPSDDDSPGD